MSARSSSSGLQTLDSTLKKILDDSYANLEQSIKFALEHAKPNLIEENERLRTELQDVTNENAQLQEELRRANLRIAELKGEIPRPRDGLDPYAPYSSEPYGTYIPPVSFSNTSASDFRGPLPEYPRKRSRIEGYPGDGLPDYQRHDMHTQQGNDRYDHGPPAHPQHHQEPFQRAGPYYQPDRRVKSERTSQTPASNDIFAYRRPNHENGTQPSTNGAGSTAGSYDAGYSVAGLGVHGNSGGHTNGHTTRNPEVPLRPRLLVCHACYAIRAKCDNGTTCRNCTENGTECVRTLCPYWQAKGSCTRREGSCFKVHDEQGYTITNDDPFQVRRKDAVANNED